MSCMHLRPVVSHIVIAILAIGCASHKPHPSSPKIRIGRIDVKGAASADRKELLGGLGLVHARDDGRPFERYLVAMDRRRVRGYFARRGFFDVTIEVNVERGTSAVDVTFAIVEGARARLARVEITGLPPGASITEAQLRALIALEDGAPYDHATWELARPAIISALENAGYAHARIDDTVFADRTRNVAVIRIRIDPGPLVRFGAVTLTGVGGDLAEAARARLQVEEGAVYSTSAIDRSREALYEMGRFSMVRVETKRGERDEVVPLAIEVALATRHELRLGGGAGMDPTSFEVRGRASYSIAGWPRPLYTTRAELRPAVARLRDQSQTSPRLETHAAIERLDLFRLRMRGELEGGFDYVSVEPYTSVGPRLHVGLRTPLLERRVHVAAGWRIQALQFRDLHPALDPALIERLGLTGTYVLGFYEQNVIVDLRDNPVAPRRGGYGELRVEEGTRAAGGEFTYAKLVPELRGYASLGSLTAVAHARFGAILGDVPVTRRFFSGGANSQRGFPERRLAPFATGLVDGASRTVPYGGGALLELGAELRAPLGTIRGLVIGGVVFLDGGDVTERAPALDPLDVHWAAGAGLRIATPVGPFRFDLGYRLNRTGAGEPLPGQWFAFHLSIGEAF